MVSEGIFINGEKVTFNPENILNGDVSAYTEAIGEATQDWLDEHLEPGGSVPIDDTLTIAGAAADAKKTGDEIAELKSGLTTKANIDGSYEDLVSGGAYQIISNMEEVDNTPYGYRTAGGNLEIGDREKLKKIVGGTINWNQLAHTSQVNASKTENGVTITDNRDGTYTVSTDANGATANTYSALSNADIALKSGHKYLLCGTPSTGSANTYYSYVAGGTTVIDYGKGLIFTAQTDGLVTPVIAYIKQGTVIVTPVTFKQQIFDLTAMFGSTIADYIYSLEQAHAGDGVAWFRKYFPKDYYEYNSGELISVSGLSAHKMTGFNQWDEEWELGGIANADGAKYTDNARIRSKNYIPVFPSTTYYFKMPSALSHFKLAFYDADKTFISYTTKRNETFVTPANCHYMMIAENATDYGTTYNHDICINLHWDGERDGEYEPYEEHSYPIDSDVTLRGIPKLDANNNLYYDGDEYVTDGTVTRKRRRIVIDGNTYKTISVSLNNGVYYTVINAFTSDIRAVNSDTSTKRIITNAGYNDYPTVGLGNVYITGNGLTTVFCLFDQTLTDITSVNNYFASHPIVMEYELATPTTESADPYTEIQNVSNWGTEEFVTTSLVPVGHETAYQPDLRAKVEVAPESPDTDGYYLMKRENGENAYVAYLGELPSDPTTDGTYTLKCTVASGTATKTWEADT